MIHGVLKLIRHELDTYLDDASSTDQVVLGNISQWDPAVTATSFMQNKVVITLVNMSEESAMKNRQGPPDASQPPVPLNLYLLFVVNRIYAQYDQALNQMGKIVRFFRSKPVFTHVNTPPPPNTIEQGEPFKLVFEMQPMDFETQNNLWSMLGGKQLPAVLFKVRVLEIPSDVTQPAAPLVSQIGINSQLTNPQ